MLSGHKTQPKLTTPAWPNPNLTRPNKQLRLGEKNVDQ